MEKNSAIGVIVKTSLVMTSIYFLKNIVKILRVSVLALVFSNGAVAADRNLVENGTDTSAGVDKSIIPKPHIRKRIYIGSGFYVVRVAFSPDGRYIAAGDAASPNIIIWDLEKIKSKLVSFHGQMILAVRLGCIGIEVRIFYGVPIIGTSPMG